MNTSKRKLIFRKLTVHGYLKCYENSNGTHSYYRSVIKITSEEFYKLKT